jgi:hypothetical protein
MERTLTKWLIRSSFAEVSKTAQVARHQAAI